MILKGNKTEIQKKMDLMLEDKFECPDEAFAISQAHFVRYIFREKRKERYIPPYGLTMKEINEEGEKFVDNSISLRLTSGGKTIVDKVFTKGDFASLVDAKYMKQFILEGLVYDKTTPKGIVYAASICYPQTDLYIPLSLTITPDGKITMMKEELLEDLHPTDSMN